MNRFILTECTTIDAALLTIGTGNAVVKAGGVDLLDRMKNGVDQPHRIVNIANIASLRGIRERSDGVLLGPLVTLAEIVEHPLLRERYRVLVDAAACAAPPQIRTIATVGGNLLQRPRCWYYRSSDFHCLKKGGDRCFAIEGLNQYHAIFDNKVCPVVAPSSVAVALCVLNATLELTSSRARRSVPVSEFYLKPDAAPQREHIMRSDELLTGIAIPLPALEARSAYQKYGEKDSFDWAIADAGVLLEMDRGLCRRAVIVLGAASPTPRRAAEAEAILTGETVTEEIARRAGEAAMSGAVPLSMNAYKVKLFPVAICRTILVAAGKREREPGQAS